MHIDSVIEDNYHRIKDDISMILQSHGIGVENGAEEVPTDAGQPQVHEDNDAFRQNLMQKIAISCLNLVINDTFRQQILFLEGLYPLFADSYQIID